MKLSKWAFYLVAAITIFYLSLSGCSYSGPSGVFQYTLEEKGQSVAVDHNGNVYVSGVYTGDMDFDPGPEIDEHKSEKRFGTFLSAFKSYGDFSWARTWSGDIYHLNDRDVTVDGNGNIYVTGTFSEVADFDPGPAVDEHYGGVFLKRFDSKGNMIWSKIWNADTAEKVLTDSQGNIYVTGYLNKIVICGDVDFDPGPGEERRLGPGVFLFKFNSDGDFIWTRTCNWNEGAQIAVNDNGDIYIGGIFTGKVDFDPGEGTANYIGNDSLFLCKIDSDGNFVFAHAVEKAFKCMDACIALDPNSDVLIGGTFSDYYDLNPGSNPNYPASNGKEDIFLSKFDSSGNFLWNHSYGGPYHDSCLAVTVDDKGNIYSTGYFSGIVDLDPGPSKDEHKSRGPGVYLSKFDPSGRFQWARSWGGGGWDKGDGIAIDDSGGVYVSGEFHGSVDFDPSRESDWHTSEGYNDIFLSKFDSDGNFEWARTWGGINPTIGT